MNRICMCCYVCVHVPEYGIYSLVFSVYDLCMYSYSVFPVHVKIIITELFIPQRSFAPLHTTSIYTTKVLCSFTHNFYLYHKGFLLL